MKQMTDEAETIEGFFLEGHASDAARRRSGTRQLFAAGAGSRSDRCVRTSHPQARGRRLFLSSTVGGQRVQAAQPVPALDGASRQPRSRRVDARVAGATRRAARHARDPRRPMSSPDALHEPRLADGAGHHRVASASRSVRPGEVRLLALPSRDDERLRLQPRPAGCAVSAAWGVPATRA